MFPNNSFWQASVTDMMRGNVPLPEKGCFVCLFCGYKAEQGRIYPEGEYFYDAEKHIGYHIRQQHGSPLKMLLQLDKRWTGLTELQARLIELFASGAGDQEIASQTGSGSVSTIRNHRYILREKGKQAKIFLAIAELMEQQATENAARPPLAPVDPVEAEVQKILRTYFPQGTDGPLSTFPTREKRRLILLRQIATRFAPDRTYTEKEINKILGAVYDDHVLLRRLLIDYKFLTRRPDGSEYRLAIGPEKSEEKDEDSMNIQPERKKELLREYKETPRPMGVFQIKNNISGKVFLLKALDIPGIMNRHQLELTRGLHRNQALQKDWDQWGADVFSFEVLATLKPEEFLPDQWPKAVEALLEEWLEKLQPYGEKGYNKKKPDSNSSAV